MATVISIDNTQEVPLQIAPTDAKGNPAPLATPATWALSGSTLGAVLNPAADGNSAVLVSGTGAEVVTVTVTSGSLTDSIVVTITAAAAVALNLTAGTPSIKP